ncbi:MAG TPA: hypothetical protein PLG99_02490 [Kaistiaceae bacterium]|nr:hypothetical protein [Kaistiaceae bacterium]
MFRFVIRVLGLWLLALSFVFLVVDGTRSIADSALTFSAVGELWYDFDPASLSLAQAAVERHVSPVLWDPVIQWLLMAPAWMIAGIVGATLMVIGRKRDLIGDDF